MYLAKPTEDQGKQNLLEKDPAVCTINQMNIFHTRAPWAGIDSTAPQDVTTGWQQDSGNTWTGVLTELCVAWLQWSYKNWYF